MFSASEQPSSLMKGSSYYDLSPDDLDSGGQGHTSQIKRPVGRFRPSNPRLACPAVPMGLEAQAINLILFDIG